MVNGLINYFNIIIRLQYYDYESKYVDNRGYFLHIDERNSANVRLSIK